jgi:iron complex outermembrane receptor protein
VGAGVRLSKGQVLSLNLSSAWRPPHVSELFSIGTHQSAAAIEYGLFLNDKTNEVMDFDHADFRSEQALKLVTTYQANWKNYSLEVTPYVNYVFNYIYLRPTGVTTNVRGVYPYFRYTQTDAVFLGADITGTWKVRSDLKVTPRVSLLRARDGHNHDYLVYIPSNTYHVTVRYERPMLSGLRNVYVESAVKYVARQRRAPRVVSVREIIDAQEQQNDPFENDKSNFDFMAAPEGYAWWNLAAGISLKGKKVQYDFRIASDNTLNQRYREYTNRFRYYADDMGRNIIVSLKCIF